MSATHDRIVRCFLLARQVIHYYWVHTAADDRDGRVSIENIEQVVERMIRIPINKIRVFVDDAGSIRGSYERYADRIEIYIRDGQGELWERFTAIKEYCHALMDVPEFFSTDAERVIQELKKFSGFLSDELSPALWSEKMAELMALEIIYPFEFRESDRTAKSGGESVGSISVRRGVPPLWVEHALGEHFEACKDVWALIPNEPLANKLDPL